MVAHLSAGTNPPLQLTARPESWALAHPLVISRGSMTHAQLVVVEVQGSGCIGRGEACPVEHFGETFDGVMRQISAVAAALAAGEPWQSLHERVPPGAARNAVDCAIWDWRAKYFRRPVWTWLGIEAPVAVETTWTISLDTPSAMAAAAHEAHGYTLLKLKLGATADMERLQAVRKAVPQRRLIVDVNEAWNLGQLREFLPALASAAVELIEQPLPHGQDAPLNGFEHVVPIAADESCHTTTDLDRVCGTYDVVNIKLDKTGGLTEAMRLARRAREAGLGLMMGCTLGTSLAMAPALLVAQLCRWADLDAPLLIGRDRPGALVYRDGRVSPSESALWG